MGAGKATGAALCGMAAAAGGWVIEVHGGSRTELVRGTRRVTVYYRQDGAISSAHLMARTPGRVPGSWSQRGLAKVGPRDRDKFRTVADWFIGKV